MVGSTPAGQLHKNSIHMFCLWKRRLARRSTKERSFARRSVPCLKSLGSQGLNRTAPNRLADQSHCALSTQPNPRITVLYWLSQIPITVISCFYLMSCRPFSLSHFLCHCSHRWVESSSAGQGMGDQQENPRSTPWKQAGPDSCSG